MRPPMHVQAAVEAVTVRAEAEAARACSVEARLAEALATHQRVQRAAAAAAAAAAAGLEQREVGEAAAAARRREAEEARGAAAAGVAESEARTATAQAPSQWYAWMSTCTCPWHMHTCVLYGYCMQCMHPAVPCGGRQRRRHCAHVASDCYDRSIVSSDGA